MGARRMTPSLADYRGKLLLAGPDWRLELFARGWPRSAMIEQANLTKPDIVRHSADAALDAGADILVTNTEAANVVGLADRIESGEIDVDAVMELNRRGAALCRSAVSDEPTARTLVFGAIGPVEPLLTLDEIEESVLESAYASQVAALADGGVDAIICRHFSELAALLVAVRAAKVAKLPIVACMVFDCGADYRETALGVTVPQACAALIEAGVAMVGCDDGENPDSTVGIVASIRSATTLPIWAALKAGLPQLIDGKIVYPEKPSDYSIRLKALVKAGANVIAGGSGVSTDHLAAMAAAQMHGK